MLKYGTVKLQSDQEPSIIYISELINCLEGKLLHFSAERFKFKCGCMGVLESCEF